MSCVSYRTRRILANGLSINARQVLCIFLEWNIRQTASSDNLIPEMYSAQASRNEIRKK